MKLRYFLVVLFFCGHAFAEPKELEQHLLRTVLRPWVSTHLSKFDYVGADGTSERPFSWSFVDRDDPHLRSTFPLDVQMEFCLTPEVAHNYMHASDWCFVGVRNTGKVSSHIGDESDVYDVRTTYQGLGPDAKGGWVYCRVGTCSFFIRSYSVAIEAMKDLAAQISAGVARFPEPSRKIRENGETKFLQAIAESRKKEEEFRKTPPENRLPDPFGGPPPDEHKP